MCIHVKILKLVELFARFSVFGLGSTAYPNFCAFVHSVDTMFGEMGAERLLEIGEGDELAGQEDSFKNWVKNIFAVCFSLFVVLAVLALS